MRRSCRQPSDIAAVCLSRNFHLCVKGSKLLRKDSRWFKFSITTIVADFNSQFDILKISNVKSIDGITRFLNRDEKKLPIIRYLFASVNNIAAVNCHSKWHLFVTMLQQWMMIQNANLNSIHPGGVIDVFKYKLILALLITNLVVVNLQPHTERSRWTLQQTYLQISSTFWFSFLSPSVPRLSSSISFSGNRE